MRNLRPSKGFRIALLGFCLLLSLNALGQQEKPEPETKGATGSEYLEPSGGQLTIGGEEGFGIGSQLGDPSALKGPDRTPVVLPGTERNATANFTGYYLQKLGERQRFLAELNVDPFFAGIDLGYQAQPEGWDGVLGFNFSMSSGLASPFTQGDRDVSTITGEDEPWVYQMNTGVEYLQSYTEDLDLAVALGYSRVQVADSQFGGTFTPFDVSGAPLTVSPDGTDDFFFLSTHGIYSTLNDRNLPTEGTKIRFGLEQAVPIGTGDVSYTRVAANIAHLFEAPGIGDGPHSFLLNLQAGHFFGNTPPWGGFNLGGVNSVRGYTAGEVAASRSFLQGTAEYRMHLTDFMLFEEKSVLRGVAFVDYATDLRTSEDVIGRPGTLRLKPGQGTGYGVGLQLGTGGGLFRLETAWDDNGNNTFYLTVGDRF